MRFWIVLLAFGAVWAWRTYANEPQSPPSPPPDPVVHCVGGDDGDGYFRQSDCKRQGGRVDEPVWAQSP